ncbi:hypothetical protein QCA50_002225 [Cerrena zonata]|uniref:Lethal giant larvae (Lgl)-like C-terminal domain-containing protein n=1 Tax=Cerrena zonata TaxID=2478898 RepID=A0AAW0GXL0_9APHY
MFSRHEGKVFVDLSAELNDESDWKPGILRNLSHYIDVSSLAYEPIAGLLAIGTSHGSIHIFGSPGVDIRLEVSERTKVKLLQFSPSALKLLCVDDHERLHIWDLTSPGRPKLQKITNSRHPINALSLSPSHTHAFIALSNGEVKTYDLLCAWYSPYTIPNQWSLYEEKMSATGMPGFNEPGSQMPFDVVVHPRDLNMIFIVYGGGVVLYNLTEQKVLRTFELILPPGAPGGAGYNSPDLMTHRRPSVTAFAIHPAGHFFATGHVDGSIAFWALDDEDKPLIVRTLDEVDVHVVDAAKLDEVMSSPDKSTPMDREPIFKLAWSGYSNSTDPRGGDTTLTILGGTNANESPGVTVILFPAFNPTEVPNSLETQHTLPPQVRRAMKQSLDPKDAHIYYTKGIIQDFFLLPKESPHFSGTFDPTAIILVYDSARDARATEAYQFPPPSFVSPSPPPAETNPVEADTQADPVTDNAASSGENEDKDPLADELADTLLSMVLTDDDPKQLQLPTSLWSGVAGGTLYTLDKHAFESLMNQDETNNVHGFPLRGGVAWVEDTEQQMKLMKVQPNRVLITYHRDLIVRFQDLTAKLLVSSETSPLTSSFPNPIPHLAIDLTPVLSEPAIATRTSPRFFDEARIQYVQLATECLECGIVLQTGEVVIYRLDHGEASSTSQTVLEDKELIGLSHIVPQTGHKYRPAFMFMSGRGPMSAFALSDIGFLASAYDDGSLFIVDMRGPRVILRDTSGTKEEHRSLFHGPEANPVVSLTWTVTGTSVDHTPRILLIAVRASSATTIHTVLRSQTGAWSIKTPPEKTEAAPHPLPGGSIVINTKGYPCRADRNGLTVSLTPPTDPSEFKRSIWITAGSKGARCVADVTGEKLGRTEWGSKIGKVEQVEVIRKNAATVLVAYTDRRQAVVYSLPFLEHLHTLQMVQTSAELLSTDGTGDYIEWVRHLPSGLINLAKYGTLFDIRRSAPYASPDVILADETRTVPPQPQPVSIGPASVLSSWWGIITSNTMTGEQIDTLLAGPDRPVPQSYQRPKPHAIGEGPGSSTSINSAANNARYIASSASSAANGLYNRLGAAMAERGEMLGQLQESFDSLEQGSRKMLAQTKTMAAQQTAKGWFGF